MSVTDVAAGLVDPTPGHPFVNCRPVHVHDGSTVPGDTSAALRGLVAANKVPAAQGQRNLRVPTEYAAPEE